MIRKRFTAREEGFTLAEVLVVVVILGILAAFVFPQVAGKLAKAKVNAAKSQIGMLESGLRAYEMDIGKYPSTEEGLQALVAAPADPTAARNWNEGGYLENTKQVPKDPWGQTFNYLGPGEAEHNPNYDLWSNGADGVSGTQDDVGNW